MKREQLSIIGTTSSVQVLYKPPGWVVNRAETVREETVQDWVEKQPWFQKQDDEVFTARSGIAHRIDKETSGLLLVARTSESLQSLLDQFRERRISKSYLALVHGEMTTKEGSIRLPIERHPLQRHRFTVDPNGRWSETLYERQQVYTKGDDVFTLVRAFPKTGRTHQIRVHFSYLKYPLVSDPTYLHGNTLKEDLRWCDRLFLHAEKIEFTDTMSKERVIFMSDMPKDLERALAMLTIKS